MSREHILQRIKANKPSSIPLKEYTFETIADDLLNEFCTRVEEVGGIISDVDEFSTDKYYPASKNIGSMLPGYGSNIDLKNASTDSLQSLNLAILEGAFAVAENGAVWLPEKNMGQRVVPFVTENLVLLLKKINIVATMHDAYNRLTGTGDYGVFISGPSKTADIEQTLVLGAQGPLSLRVVLIN